MGNLKTKGSASESVWHDTVLKVTRADNKSHLPLIALFEVNKIVGNYGKCLG